MSGLAQAGVPQGEEALETQHNRTTQPTGRGGAGARDAEGPERTPNSKNWNNLSKKIDKAVLGYNPKHKINVHKSILIQRND